MGVSILRPFAVLIVCVSVIAVSSACSKAPTTPSPTTTYTQTDLILGTGTQAATGNTVTVDYTGWLFDPSKVDNKGLQFDSSIGRGPFTFALGGNQVIAGWDQGVPGMKIGGVRRLIVPPSLAYGTSRNGPIPANATLVFDIQLLDVQ